MAKLISNADKMWENAKLLKKNMPAMSGVAYLAHCTFRAIYRFKLKVKDPEKVKKLET